MGSFSVAVRNAWLNALARGVAYSNAEMWVQLHIGDPGAAGTDNPAANTTRMQATFGTAASAGAISNTADVTWVDVPATETYSHVSMWSTAVGGSLLGVDELAAPVPITAGQDFTIAIGEIALALP